MIAETRDVLRYTCDGIACNVERLHEPDHHERESDTPVGWCRIGTGFRFVVFHDIECAWKWIDSLVVEQRDTGGGWIKRGDGR